jgi:hypothetical protein
MYLLKKSLALFALFAVVAMPAEAARRTALSGNLLIPDRDDVFIYPQLAVDHLNEIWFDYGLGRTDGSGLMLFGSKTFVLGVAINRAATTTSIGGQGLQLLRDNGTPGGDSYEQTNLASTGSAFGGAPGMDPLAAAFARPETVVDVIMAFPVSGRNKLGFRLGIANGQTSSKPVDGDDEIHSETAVRLQGGLSLPGSSFAADLAVEIGFHTGSDTLVNGDPNDTGQVFVLQLKGRGFSRMSEKLDLGVLGEIGFASGSRVNDPGDFTESVTALALVVGAGPTYKLGKSTVNGHAVLGFGQNTHEPNSESDDDIVTHTEVLLPGVRMSFETPIIEEYLWFRSGMEYIWVAHTRTNENNATASDRGSSPAFGWNAGFGLVLGKFKFDGALNHGWLTQMPTAIGGGGQMLVMASAAYDWE